MTIASAARCLEEWTTTQSTSVTPIYNGHELGDGSTTPNYGRCTPVAALLNSEVLFLPLLCFRSVQN
jgi:hypothetical protein